MIRVHPTSQEILSTLRMRLPALFRASAEGRMEGWYEQSLSNLSTRDQQDLLQGIEARLRSRSNLIRARAIRLINLAIPHLATEDRVRPLLLLQERLIEDPDQAVASLAGQAMAQRQRLLSETQRREVLLHYVTHPYLFSSDREPLFRSTVLASMIPSITHEGPALADDLVKPLSGFWSEGRIRAFQIMKELLAQDLFPISAQIALIPKILFQPSLSSLEDEDRERLAELGDLIVRRCLQQQRSDELLAGFQKWTLDDDPFCRRAALTSLLALFPVFSQSERIHAARIIMLPMVFDLDNDVRAAAKEVFVEVLGLIPRSDLFAVISATSLGSFGFA
jgi:hypothetical protein